MEPEGSLSFQESPTGHYPEPAASSPHRLVSFPSPGHTKESVQDRSPM
jgi:hypothetical protein